MLSFLLVVSLCVISIGPVAAEKSAVLSDFKIYADLSSDRTFADDRVMVIMARDTHSSIRKYVTSNFSEIDVTHLEDLTAINGDINSKPYINEDEYRQILTLKLKKTGKNEVIKAIQKLEKRKDVYYVGPAYTDITPKTCMIPNDPYYLTPIDGSNHSQSTYFNQISLPQAWDKTTGSKDVKVGIIEEGFNFSNMEDILDNVAYQWNFADNSSNMVIDGHATACASIIAAIGNNGMGMTGVCQHISLYALAIDSFTGNGKTWPEAYVDALRYASNHDVGIISQSYLWNTDEPTMRQAIQNYQGLLVVAAGNQDYNLDGDYSDDLFPFSASYGAFFPNVLVVTATNLDGNFKTGTTYGSKSVGLAAPGEGIVICHADGTCGTASGTSLSAPIVAGAAGLLKSYRPTATTQQLKQALLDSADVLPSLNGKVQSNGRLNVDKAMELIVKYSEIQNLGENFSEDGITYKVISYDTVQCGDGVNPAISETYTGGIDIPASVQLGDQFYTVTAIAPNAFKDCQISGVDLNNGHLESIGVHAFDGCMNLTQVVVPRSVSLIAPGAFGGRNAIANILCQESDHGYYDIDGVLYQRPSSSSMDLIAYPSGRQQTSFVVDAVSITDQAFSGNVYLMSICRIF